MEYLELIDKPFKTRDGVTTDISTFLGSSPPNGTFPDLSLAFLVCISFSCPNSRQA